MSRVISNPSFINGLKRTVVGVFAFLLLLVLIALASIFVVRRDPALLEIVIEEVASKLLDRELQIGELLDAELNWDTYLLARNVSLKNPDWAQESNFITTERLLIRINLASIWRDGPIVIHKLELDGAQVNLLAPEEYAPNWDFWPGSTPEDDEESRGDLMEDISGLVFPVLISSGRVRESELVYKDSNRNIVTTIKSLDITEPPDGGLIDVDLLGSINDLPLEAEGQIGPATALLTRENLNLNLSILLGKIEIESRGTIDNLVELTGVDMHLSLAAPRSSPLLNLLGITGVRDRPINVQAHLLEADTAVAVSAVGAMEDFNVRIGGVLRDLKALDGVDINFQLGGPSLAEAATLFGLPDLPDLSYQLSGDLQRNGKLVSLSNGLVKAGQGRVVLEGELPNFPGIDDWNIKLEGGQFRLGIVGAFFGIKDLPDRLFDLKGEFESTQEGVELLDLNLVGTDSSLNIRGVIGDPPNYFDSDVEFQFAGKSLRGFGAWLGVSEFPELAFQASAQLALKELGWQLSDGLLRAGDSEITLEGDLDQWPDPKQVTSRLKVTTADLAAALSGFGYVSEVWPVVPLTLNARLSGSPQNLKLEEATAKSGDSRLTAAGMVGDPLTLKELDLQLELFTSDLLKFFPALEGSLKALLAVELSGQLKKTAQGFAANNLIGQIGGAPLTLNGVYNTEAPHENSRISLDTRGPDLGKVLSPFFGNEVANAPFTLSLDAYLQSGGVKIEAINASVGDAQLKAKGNITSLDEPRSGKGRIELSGPSSSNLATMLGSEISIPDSNYTLVVSVERSPEWLRLSPAALRWGESDYAGTIDIRPGEVPTVNVDLHSDYVSLPFLLPDLEALEKKELSAAADAEEYEELLFKKLTSRELKERVISDQSFDLDWINAVQGTFKYRLEEVGLGNNTSSSATIDISIADGKLSSRQISWDGSFSAGEAQLGIRARESGGEIDLYFDVQRLPVLWLLGGEPDPDPDPGAYYRGNLTASGNSFRALAKGVNGAMVFRAGGGRINNNGVDLILGDAFEELYSMLNPYRETDADTRIECSAGALTIVEGKVLAVPGIVMRTDKMNLVSSGEINLHNEKLNLAFNTRARKGLGFSASKAVTPYFKIGGTLANPRLALDVQGAALSGGAAVATAGISILAAGLWDRWVATSKNPCEILISQISTEGKKEFAPLLQAKTP